MKRKRASSHLFNKVNGKKYFNKPMLHSNDNFKNSDIGYLVWGKVPGSRIWPGIIVHYSDCGGMAPNEKNVWIFWFGDNRVSLGQISKIYCFVKNFKSCYSTDNVSLTYQNGIHEILKECHKRSGISKDVCSLEFSSLIAWAMDGFGNLSNVDKAFLPVEDARIPEKIVYMLLRIKQSQDADYGSLKIIDEFPTLSSSSESDTDSEERKLWRSKAVLLRDVRAGITFLDSICIACEKGQESCVVSPHPIFEGGLCNDCKTILDSAYLQSNELQELCTICFSPGEVTVCDNELCDRIFCLGCIELLIAPSAVEKIKKTDPWICFLCTEYSEKTHGLIIPRPEYCHKIVTKNGANDDEYKEYIEDAFMFNENMEKRPIRVLSLFDGIATGLFVLDKLNLNVEEYIASEIDENAVNVSRMQFGSRITHVGDITNWTDSKVKAICPIDLLIGGSPCNDLSFVNPLRKGLFDPNGTGILFFHFFRIQKLIQVFNKDRHLFWLFENVVAMPKEYKQHISKFLQRNPVIIDAQFFSPQKRARNFWGNIPSMYKPLPEHIISKKHTLSSFIISECNREAKVEKINCITTNANSLRIKGGSDYPVLMNGNPDIPWITEIEKIFGFPAHYTDVGNLGVRDRQALLGRAWSVPVISHILSSLQEYFLQSDKREELPKEPLIDLGESSFDGF